MKLCGYLSSNILNFDQDVVFLDFSKLVKKEKMIPVDIVRRIFVDINTNAKKVDFVRQVLMDDKDLSALIVQSLVDSADHEGSMKPDSEFLRPEIVDWYGEGLKPRLPHLTGVLSLYQIIDDHFVKVSLTSMGDYRSLSKARNWVNRLNTLFNIDNILQRDFPEIETLGKSLLAYEARIKNNKEYFGDIDDEFKESELFRFDYRILEIAQREFEKVYMKSIIYFFENLRPYNSIISKVQSKMEGTSLALALTLSKKKLGERKDMRNMVEDLRKELELSFFPKNFLMYTVLAQKSIFLILFKRILANISSGVSEISIRKSTEELLLEINNLFDFIDTKEVSIFGKKENVLVGDSEHKLMDFGTIYNSFYDGLIYEGSSIIYNTQGVRSFSSFIEYLIEVNEGRMSLDKISLFDIPYFKVRSKRILEKSFDHLPSENINQIVDEIIFEKSKFLAEYMAK